VHSWSNWHNVLGMENSSRINGAASMVVSPALRRFLRAGLHGAALTALCALLLMFHLGTAWAQTARPSPLSPPDTSNPRSTLLNFRTSVDQAAVLLLEAYRRNNAETSFFRSREVNEAVARADALLTRAARSLDLSDVPPVIRSNRSLEATLLLKEILDRTPMPALDAVPGPDAVGPDPSKGLAGWTIPGTEIRIVRMTGGQRTGDYLVSSDSLHHLDEIYAGIKDMPDVNGKEDFYAFYSQSPGHLLPPKWYSLIEALPWPFRFEIEGQAVWQWLGLALLLIVALAWLMFILRVARRFRSSGPVGILFGSIVAPAMMAATAMAVMYVASYQINITGQVEDTVRDMTAGLAFLALVWGVLALSNGLALIIERSPLMRPESIDASLTRAAIRTAGLAVACSILVYGASQLGLPLAGILAGLGVGGLAIALAAKPTIENFIGGLILYADRPVRVGDMCRFDDLEGQVEGIGIRSTRIRGLDRTLITVPNSVFVNLNLINLSNRDGMPFNRVVKIRSPGDSAAIRDQIATIVSTVARHPKVDPTSVRVRLREGHEEQPSVEVRAILNTGKWDEFLGIQQEIDLILRDTLAGRGETRQDCDAGERGNIYRLEPEADIR
jgi:MscS family membrane protein